MHKCPACGNKVTKYNYIEPFEYGDTILKAEVPLYLCSGCDLKYTDHIGEKARENSVSEYLENIK